MVSFLDCFANTKISNNRFVMPPIDREDEIVIGGTCVHVFDLPFDLDENTNDISITYTQGLTKILTKLHKDCKIVKKGMKQTSIIIKLFPIDTLKFKRTYLDTLVQIKVATNTGDILFSKTSSITIKEPLDSIVPGRYTIKSIAKNLTLYEYYTLNYEKALCYYGQVGTVYTSPIFGLNFINNSLIGVNFDDLYASKEQRIVHVFPDNENVHHSSIGISNMPTFESLSVCHEECAKILLPFFTTDGLNDAGLFCSLTTVYDDNNIGAGIVRAKVFQEDRFSGLMLPRFILDNFTSVAETIEYLRDYVTIDLPVIGDSYTIHILLADQSGSAILEFYPDASRELQIKVIASENACNFQVNGIIYNQDNTLHYPGLNSILLVNQLDPRYIDAQYNSEYLSDDENAGPRIVASDELTVKAFDSILLINKAQPHSRGIERYNYMVKYFNELAQPSSKENMRQALAKTYYTNTYKSYTDPFWYSEFVGSVPFHDFTIDSVVETYHIPREELDSKSVIDYVLDQYKDMQDHLDAVKDYKLYKTAHSCVYDIKNKKVYLSINESPKEFEFLV